MSDARSSKLPSFIPPKGQDEMFKRLNGLSANPEAIIEEQKRLTTNVNAAVGFRWQSESTKQDEDFIKRNYMKWLEGMNFIYKTGTRERATMTERQVDLAAFPKDDLLLKKLLCMFVAWVAENAPGRTAKDKISFKRYIRYRGVLIKWADRCRTKYNLKHLAYHLLYNKMTEVMMKCGIEQHLDYQGNLNTTQVGLPELRILIDHTLRFHSCIALLECHQLAWCLGRTAALRPGSLGMQKEGKLPKGHLAIEHPYLTWRDIKIIREPNPGNFTAFITIRMLKTNTNVPETGADRGKSNHKRQLPVKIGTPRDNENLVFSIPHRLLVMLLRRHYLEKYNSIEELVPETTEEWNALEKNIQVKDEFLDKPVLLKGGPGGRYVIDQPLSAHALTEYLQHKGADAGLGGDLIFYSLRRCAINDLIDVIGPEATRELCNHDPESRTMERDYMNILPRTDLTAAAFREPGIEKTQGGRTERYKLETHDISIHAMDNESLQRVFGPPLNALIAKMLRETSGVERSAAEKKAHRQRIRKIAWRHLMSQEQLALRSKIQTGQYESSLAKLSAASEACTKVFRAAMTDLNKKHDSTADIDQFEDGDLDIAPGVDPQTQTFKTAGAPAEFLEDDFDDRIGNVDGDYLECDADEEGGEGDDVPLPDDLNELDVDRAVSGKIFMNMMLMDKFRIVRPRGRGGGLICEDCVGDPTVPDDQKSKEWASSAKLADHRTGLYHVPQAQWKREQQIAARKFSPEEFWCPYCTAVDEPQKFSTYALLRKHLVRVKDPRHNHYPYMKNEGWFDPGWRKSQSDEAKQRSEKWRESRMESIQVRMGVRWSSDRELAYGVPDEEFPDEIVWGGPDNDDHPREFVSMDEISDAGPEIPPWVDDYIDWDGVPGEFETFNQNIEEHVGLGGWPGVGEMEDGNTDRGSANEEMEVEAFSDEDGDTMMAN